MNLKNFASNANCWWAFSRWAGRSRRPFKKPQSRLLSVERTFWLVPRTELEKRVPTVFRYFNQNDEFAIMFWQIKNPTNAKYFTNRALCYIKMKKFESAVQDCRRALDMDANLIKGHFFLGLSLMELQLFDEAIKHLQRGELLFIFKRTLTTVISLNSFINQQTRTGLEMKTRR